jgi:hypothetical protein
VQVTRALRGVRRRGLAVQPRVLPQPPGGVRRRGHPPSVAEDREGRFEDRSPELPVACHCGKHHVPGVVLHQVEVAHGEQLRRDDGELVGRQVFAQGLQPARLVVEVVRITVSTGVEQDVLVAQHRQVRQHTHGGQHVGPPALEQLRGRTAERLRVGDAIEQ